MSVEVCLLSEKPCHHVLKVVHHDTTKVVKLSQKNVVQCLTVLAHLLCLLFLPEGEEDMGN